MKYAYFAGGCFWCITPVFREQPGVLEVISGFSGGDEANPRYEDVKAGLTRHRETIRIAYDPDRISYDRLLDIFLWSVDPFDADGQFIDRGRSYTLAVYYTDESEREAAQRHIRELEMEAGQAAQIALEPFKSFYPAEAYHQNYDLKNPALFRREWAESGREQWFSEKDNAPVH